MNRELGQSFFDTFLQLKAWLARMDGIVLEVITIQQTLDGRYLCIYWAIK